MKKREFIDYSSLVIGFLATPKQKLEWLARVNALAKRLGRKRLTRNQEYEVLLRVVTNKHQTKICQ